MKKYLFKYVFLIIFIIGSVYSPPVYAGNVVAAVATVVNSISAIAISIVMLNPVSMIIGSAVDSTYIETWSGTVDCYWGSSKFGKTCLDSNIGPGITSIGVADSAACVGSAKLTFYNDVGPHSLDEATSMVEIYRFTLSKDATYWPWSNYATSLEGQKNAAVVHWVSGSDQRVGNGLFGDYDFKGASYFLSDPSIITKSEQAVNIAAAQQAIDAYNAEIALDPDYDYYGTMYAGLAANLAAASNPGQVIIEPYATTTYSQACDANGACKIFDQ